MEPKIVLKDEFKVVGIAARISCENENNFVEIPKLWDSYLDQNICEKIPNRVNPCISFGVCADFDGANNFTYIICSEVSSFDNVAEGMICRTIPAAKYAVFTAKGPVPEKIQEVCRYIYGTWFPNSGYERADSEDFELYDERCTGDESSEVDIYVPIK
ncbi:MAG: GyrI-like domain-containing protein [Clostridia bacterium]|nr:GyrI-like domain-containing protein [Clostridia bacterium]